MKIQTGDVIGLDGEISSYTVTDVDPSYRTSFCADRFGPIIFTACKIVK